MTRRLPSTCADCINVDLPRAICRQTGHVVALTREPPIDCPIMDDWNDDTPVVHVPIASREQERARALRKITAACREHGVHLMVAVLADGPPAPGASYVTGFWREGSPIVTREGMVRG